MLLVSENLLDQTFSSFNDDDEAAATPTALLA